jgi:hypothetical protein
MSDYDSLRRIYCRGMCDAMALALYAAIPNSRLVLLGFTNPENAEDFEPVHAAVRIGGMDSSPILLDVLGIFSSHDEDRFYLSLNSWQGPIVVRPAGGEDIRYAFSISGVSDDDIARAYEHSKEIISPEVWEKAAEMALRLSVPKGFQADERWQIVCPPAGHGKGWMPLAEVARYAEDVFSPDGGDLTEYEDYEEWVETSSVLKKVTDLYRFSNCYDFAAALEIITGWPQVHVQHKNGYHMLNRSPDGHLIDVTGWADDAVRAMGKVRITEGEKVLAFSNSEIPEDTYAFDMALSVIRQLPWEPFNHDWFRQMSFKKIKAFEETASPKI